MKNKYAYWSLFSIAIVAVPLIAIWSLTIEIDGEVVELGWRGYMAGVILIYLGAAILAFVDFIVMKMYDYFRGEK